MKTALAHLLSVSLLVGLGGSLARAGTVPQQISYQGQLRQAGGAPLARGVYIIQARIWDNATGGKVLWGLAYPVSVDTNGTFNVNLGDGGGATTPAPAYATLGQALDGGPRYLGITVVQTPAGAVGAPQEITPRMQFLSSPYALRAGMADQARAYRGQPVGNFGVEPVWAPDNSFSAAANGSTILALGFDRTNSVLSGAEAVLTGSASTDGVSAYLPFRVLGSISTDFLRGNVVAGTNGMLFGTNVSVMCDVAHAVGYGTASQGSHTVIGGPSAGGLLFVSWAGGYQTSSQAWVDLTSATGQTNRVVVYSGRAPNTNGSYGFTVLPIPCGARFTSYGVGSAYFRPFGR